LSESQKFGEGYDAIFGGKKKAAAKPRPAAAKPAAKKRPAKKK
jgi:hypothetical protein